MQLKNITIRIGILTLAVGASQLAMAENQGTPVPLPPPSAVTQEIALVPVKQEQTKTNVDNANGNAANQSELAIAKPVAITTVTPQQPTPNVANNPIDTTTNNDTANFDKRFLSFMRSWQMPGSSVAIIKNGKFILAKGYGMADVANQKPVRADSVFRVASVSKAITAVAALQLVQQGKLNLDDKVYRILGDLQPLTAAAAPSRIYDITVRNLLEMSSGWITNRGVDPMFGPWTKKMLDQLQYETPPDCKTAAQMMMTIPFQYAPGKQYSYSNINYCMLGLIINKISGLPGYAGYESYVKQKLFTPFGIHSLRIGDTYPGQQQANEVRYYYYLPKNSEDNPSARRSGLPYGEANILRKNFADGGWIGTAPDLARFVQALGEHKILGPRMIATMSAQPACQKDRNSYFAMGWSVKNIRGHRFILKTGSFTGTQALIMLADNGTAYAALFNAKPGNRKLFNQQLQNLLVAFTHPETGSMQAVATAPLQKTKKTSHQKTTKVAKKVKPATKVKTHKVVKKQENKHS